jgi:hypothetical protein
LPTLDNLLRTVDLLPPHLIHASRLRTFRPGFHRRPHFIKDRRGVAVFHPRGFGAGFKIRES